MPRRCIQLNAVQTLALGFAALIVAGGVLLALPVSSRDGHALPFLDALFTAASASCVTGLVLYDTCTQFTLFGQAVILLLIQVGGMGFMTVSILVAVLLHRRIGLRQRSILMDSVGALQMGGIVRLTRRAIRVTYLRGDGGGAAGAVVLPPVWGGAGPLDVAVSRGLFLLQRRVRPAGHRGLPDQHRRRAAAQYRPHGTGDLRRPGLFGVGRSADPWPAHSPLAAALQNCGVCHHAVVRGRSGCLLFPGKRPRLCRGRPRAAGADGG